MTFICEPKHGDYALLLQVPGFSASGLRVTIDGTAVDLGQPIDDGSSLTFLLAQEAGRRHIASLVDARAIDVESGSNRARFALSDGAREVAEFKRLCGL